MSSTDRLRELGLFDARAPRYTSYPPANHFNDGIGPDRARRLDAIGHAGHPGVAVSAHSLLPAAVLVLRLPHPGHQHRPAR